MKESIRKNNRFFAEPSYYKMVLCLVLPMILQAGITNFVSLLDNIMVGQIGTSQMSGVSIVNQYIFVFNLTVLGAVSGPSIFGTQFFGKGDATGQKYTVRFRVLSAIGINIIGIFLFGFFKEPLIRMFLSADDNPALVAETLHYGMQYMEIVMFSLIPFTLGQVYASAVRECGKTKIPMLASFLAVGVNLILDYCLIFGALGFPQMGVAGAALATGFILIQAVATPMWSYTNASYFILRSGGKTGITFLFDFGFTWFLQLPLAFCLTRFTSMPIMPLFAIVTWSEAVKIIIGYWMVRSGAWINTIVE